MRFRSVWGAGTKSKGEARAGAATLPVKSSPERQAANCVSRMKNSVGQIESGGGTIAPSRLIPAFLLARAGCGKWKPVFRSNPALSLMNDHGQGRDLVRDAESGNRFSAAVPHYR